MEQQPGRLYTNNTAQLEEKQRVRRWKDAFSKQWLLFYIILCLFLYWLQLLLEMLEYHVHKELYSNDRAIYYYLL